MLTAYYTVNEISKILNQVGNTALHNPTPLVLNLDLTFNQLGSKKNEKKLQQIRILCFVFQQ